MSKRIWSLFTLVAVASMLLTACAQATPEPTAAPAEKIKVAFIYIGQAGDLGWTYEHDRGRKILEEQLGDQVEVVVVPDVPDWEPATSEKAIRDVAQQGAKVIFATSFGYMDPMLAVASDYPDAVFEHCSGYKTADNMSTYFGRMYQPRYLSGLVAGSMTENNFIGYVAAHPIPEVIRGINAFTLGVRKANPQAKVHVVWTNTWYDPVKEREAGVALLDEGADIIAQHQDTTEPQKAAQERGLVSIGYDSDMAQFVGDTVLTSPVWNWGPYYVETVQSVLDGTWKTHQYWGGLAGGAVELADFSPKVPDDVKALVEKEEKKIIGGDWDVFCGPFNDQGGNEKVADGQCMSDGDMLGMNWLVEGVVGTIPQ